MEHPPALVALPDPMPSHHPLTAPPRLLTRLAAALGASALLAHALAAQPTTYTAGTVPASPTLAVVRTAPGDSAGPRTIVTVTFDRPVADAVAGRPPATGLLRLSPAVPGTLRWRDPATLAFVPDSAMAPGQRYAATVAAGIVAVDGTALAREHRFTFRVPAGRLLATHATGPYPGRALLPPRPTVQLVYASPSHPDTVARLARLELAPSCTGGAARVALRALGQRPLRDDDPWELGGARHQAAPWGPASLRVLELAPVRDLPLGCRFAVVAPVTLDDPAREQRAEFATYPTFALRAARCPADRDACWRGPLVLVFSTPVRGSELQRHLRERSGVALTVGGDTSRAQLAWAVGGDFRPRTAYTFVVDDALRDLFGQAPVTRETTLQLEARPARIGVARGARVVARGDSTLLVRHVNVDSVTILATPVPTGLEERVWSAATADHNLERAWQALGTLGVPTPVTVTVPLTGARDAEVVTPVALPPAIWRDGGGRMAFVLVRIAGAAAGSSVDGRGGRVETVQPADDDLWRLLLLQRTDLAVHARLGQAGGAVWLTDAATRRARAGALVELVDSTGRVRARGRTTVAGIATLALDAEAEAAAALAAGPASAPGDDPGLQSLDHDPVQRPLGVLRVTHGDDRALALPGPPIGGWFGPDAQPTVDTDVTLARAGWLGTDRGIYRPGERVFATAVVRRGPQHALAVPARGDSVRWVTRRRPSERDWRMTVVRDTVTRLSAFGSAADSVALPADAPLGDYQLTLYAVSGGRWRPVQRASYRVAEYRAPEFLAEVTADSAPRLVAGDSLGVQVRARYLHGAPMAGAVVRWSASATPVAGWFTALPLPVGFVVGGQSWRSWSEQGRSEPQPLGQGVDTLAADGTRRLAVPTATLGQLLPGRVAGEAPTVDGPIRVRVDAAVADLNRQSVTADVSAIVHPASLYVAGRIVPRADSVEMGVVDSVERVEMLVVTPEGEVLPDVPVSMLVRRFGVPSGVPYGPPTVDTVARCTMVSGSAPAVCAWTPRLTGEHEIVLEARDARSRVTRTTLGRWVSGPDVDATWRQRSDAAVGFEQRELAPGDTARLSVFSPFAEAEAWVTVEREGILAQRRLQVRDHLARLTLPVDERWVPGVMVHVVLLAGEEAARAAARPEAYTYEPRVPWQDAGPVRTAHVTLLASPEGRRLRVAVAPARREVAPGDTSRVRVTVRDRAERPVRAEVTLWAVDEGVLALTRQPLPDPIGALYRPRGSALGLASSETIREGTESPALQDRYGHPIREQTLSEINVEQFGDAVTLGAPSPEPAPPPPPPAPADVSRGSSVELTGRGGAGPPEPVVPPVRVDFRSTAFYAGRALTGADGVAHVRARLPDGLTTYRLVAIAVGADARAGADSGALVATRPLVARPALPRFVRPGDRLDAGVVVAVRDGLPDSARVEATTSGALVREDGVTHRVAIPDARGAEARFALRVDTAAAAGDSAVARFVAVGTRGADAVELHLPVAPAFHPRVHTAAGLVRGEAALVFTLPPGTDAARSRLTLDAGRDALAVVRGAARALRAGPYDYAERLASALLAWSSLAEATDAAGRPDVPLRTEARAEAERAATLLVRQQRADGAFGFFPHGGRAEVWLSAYVGIALVAAQEAEIPVGADALARLRGFMRGALREPPPRDREPGFALADSLRQTQRWLALRVAVVDFLRRAGEPAAATEDSLLARTATMTWEDRVRLAELLAARPERRAAARALLDTAWLSARAGGRRVLLADSAQQDRPWAIPSHLRPVARLLTATLALDPDQPLLGALVETVLRQEEAERGRVWTSQDVGAVLPALARFDARRRAGAAAPLRLVAGDRTLLTLASGAAPADTAARSVSLAGLLAADGTMRARLVADGGAPAYFWASVREVPATPPVSPDASGLVVERWTERLDGTPVTQVQAGELVRVRLRVSVPEDRQFVQLEDPLPAGLEIVDLRLGTSGTLSPFLAPEAEDVAGDADRAGDRDRRLAWQGMLYGRWEDGWWSPWEHRELRDDRVVWATRLLWRGRHDVSYVARATTNGTFLRPPAHAEELYNPGLHGRSEGGTLTVRP